MSRRIIVGYDGSDQAEDALALGRLLAVTGGAELVVVEAMPYEPLLSELTAGPPTTLANERHAARERLEQLARSLEVGAESVESSSPQRGLHEAAERLEADLMVVGSSHRGSVGRVLAGSVGRSLLNGAPCAVAIAPSGYRADADHVLRTIDGDRIDLLFVGSRGYGRFRGVLLGSVSAELIRSAPCPVVVVPRGVHRRRRQPPPQWPAPTEIARPSMR